ncbi:MAG: ABC transporter permease [Nitrososphaerota archaeon]|jgi:ABC-2 type transport system permease protein|nr:ABC transporter permease [Nitrososphaerota archaeon]MDG6918733.1 ABC transporter permease [Nitrososphaerota archaeon]MDG6946646.1 ABC transporter permease [Nitrososphaerota archaeon]
MVSMHDLPPGKRVSGYFAQKAQVLKASIFLTRKLFFADPQWVIPNIIAPFVFTMVAFFLFQGQTSGSSFLLYLVLGSGLMGMWGTTIYASANSIGFDRWNGTMEATLAAPVPLSWIALGRVLFNTLQGVLNAVFILVIGLAWFRVGFSLVNPAAFFLASVATFLSLSSFGLLMTTVLLLSRKGGFITNSMEIPVYIATGTMFPIILLPIVYLPFAFMLAPTWGIEAIRIAALPGYVGLPTTYWEDMVIMAAETFAYLGLAFFLFKRVEAYAKRIGTLEEY